ncbi:MAG: hypothetical protein ACT4TC_06950, partial [Myxococcaceae bacterium]
MLSRACVLIVLLSATDAAAQTPSSTALFQQARELMRRRQFREACPLLQQSLQLEPALGTLLNLADCMEHTQRRATAYRLFNQAATWAIQTREGRREAVATERARALRPFLHFVTLFAGEIPGLIAEIPGVTQWRDYEAPQSIALDAGNHVLRLEAPGYLPTELPFTVPDEPGLTRLEAPAMRKTA